MRFLHRAIAVMFLVLWAPIATHCLWEDSIGGGFFSCVQKATPNGDCASDDDSCTTIESGGYRVPDATFSIPVPAVAVILFELPQPTLNFSQQAAPPIVTPGRLRDSWLSFSRTALPPRAPSFVS